MSLIGLLLALGLIFFLVMKVLQGYVQGPVVDKESKKPSMGQQKSVKMEYDSALSRIKSQVEDINKKTLEREKELNDL